MKKFLILMLALVCAFAMFACGDDPVIPGPDGGDKVPTELNIDEFVAAVNAPKIKKRKLKGLIKKYKNVPVTSAPPTIA